MRDYVPRKQKYNISRTAYHRALWMIRDRDRLQQAADDLLTVSALPTDHIGSKGVSFYDPVVIAASKRERYLKELDVINEALQEIPEEYREGILQSIMDQKPYPLTADRTTFSRWKSRLITSVASKAGII